MDCQHPVGILLVRVFRRNRDTADSAHRLPQATVRRAGRAEDTSVCSASPWRYGLQARSVLLLCPAFGGQCLNRT
ncbi:hypothetical protein NXV73_01300 [Bacteroides salyersiae]|nr:hypothetical protein [Bacteroides salyersiae]